MRLGLAIAFIVASGVAGFSPVHHQHRTLRNDVLTVLQSTVEATTVDEAVDTATDDDSASPSVAAASFSVSDYQSRLEAQLAKLKEKDSASKALSKEVRFFFVCCLPDTQTRGSNGGDVFSHRGDSTRSIAINPSLAPSPTNLIRFQLLLTHSIMNTSTLSSSTTTTLCFHLVFLPFLPLIHPFGTHHQSPSHLQELTIVHEDDHIVVVNKPAGVLTVPGKEGHPSLSQAVFDAVGCESGRADKMVVHRLGMETSGLVVFAKTMEALRNMNTLFRTRKVTRQYEALVCGHMEQDEGMIDLPLMRDYECPPFMRVSTDEHQRALIDLTSDDVDKKLLEQPKASLTKYEVIAREEIDGQPVTRVTLTSISGR